MYEPAKLFTWAMMLILLAPFGIVFWHCARFVPITHPSREADLERQRQFIRDQQTELDANPLSPDAARAPLTFAICEMVGPWSTAPIWLCFYPHRWVGILGLAATAVVLVCGSISLFCRGAIEIRP